jgi:FKBP-type peptidyl-prolyl cis-trans isomerase
MKKSAILLSLFALPVLGVVPMTSSAQMVADTVQKLIVTDTKVGTGATAVAGKTVSVHYTGWLYDVKAADHKGKKFDSSSGGAPIEFQLGVGYVIKGWDEGLVGMKVGGKRTLTIPSEMGYGKRGAGGMIPPNAPLLFDVELMGVN